MSRKGTSKKSSKAKGEPSFVMEYVLLGSVVLGLGYYFFKGKANHPQSLSAESAPETTSPTQGAQIQVLNSSEAQVDVKKYQEELNQQRVQFAQMRILGIKSLNLKGKGDTVSIPLVFAPKKMWCQGGDLDTMRYAAKSLKNKDFLITLETIGRPGKNPYVRTSLNQLYAGLSYTFTVPRPKGSTAYGVYICQDSKQENTCQKKLVETHAEISDSLAQQGDGAKNQDRVFFFQNLIVDNKKVETYRTNDFGSEFQKSINSHLVGKRGVNPADFQTAWNLNKTIKSAPTDVRAGKIILSLPYNDPRCLSAGATPGPNKAR